MNALMNISMEVGITVLCSLLTGLISAAVTAYGANAGLRTRVDRVETRVGITANGDLTGNGLIGENRELWRVVEKLT